MSATCVGSPARQQLSRTHSTRRRLRSLCLWSDQFVEVYVHRFCYIAVVRNLSPDILALPIYSSTKVVQPLERGDRTPPLGSCRAEGESFEINERRAV